MGVVAAVDDFAAAPLAPFPFPPDVVDAEEPEVVDALLGPVVTRSPSAVNTLVLYSEKGKRGREGEN